MREVGYKYAIEDVAGMFNVTAETVRRWCREKKIKHLKLPGVKGGFRFSDEDIKDFIARQNSEPIKRGPVGLKDIFSTKR